MRIIKYLLILFCVVSSFISFSQSTYLLQGSKEYQFIDRLEIKQQQNIHLNFSALKPYNRKYIVRQAQMLDSARLGYTDSLGNDKYAGITDLNLTPIDEYNLKSLLMNNSEWVTGSREGFKSRKPVLKNFYTTKAILYEVKSYRNFR